MRRTLISAFAAAAFALPTAVACGGDDGGPAAGGTGSGSPTVANDTVVQVDDRPEVTTPLADAQEAAIELPGGPDWLAFHDGFVWVKRDDGMVSRIDPRTNKPKGEIQADTKSDQLCQGIGAGGGAVWSCSGSDVVRIDPERLKVTDSIPVGKIFDQGHFVFADGKIWVLAGNGDRLVGIDTATASAGPAVELPAACRELGFGADMIWVTCPLDGMVFSVNPASASVEAQLELEDASVASASDSALWVGSAGDLMRFDLETLQPLARFEALDPGTEGTLLVDGEDVWVRTAQGFLHRIDATSNTVAEQIEPPEALSGGDLLIAAGSVWTTAFNDNLLIRLRAGT